jgi:hypothetical protein
LLDAYWEHKRRAIAERHPEHANQWIAAIAELTNEMSDREELSVPKAERDEFPPAFLAAMVSEGVFTFDGKRYGFGHENVGLMLASTRGRNVRVDIRLQAHSASDTRASPAAVSQGSSLTFACRRRDRVLDFGPISLECPCGCFRL